MDKSGFGFAIDLRNVVKIYGGGVQALRGVSMQVHHGEIFGLLGPNGAGKSTLVKIMMSVIRPTRAQGTVLGMRIGHKRTRARIGYLPENHRYPNYLTGRQTLDFFAALSNVDRRSRKARCGELLDLVNMTAWADTQISQYSKGMMQRIGLAQALTADPDLVVLDEPTDGVDPGGRKDIRQALLAMRDRGKTIFVNSHLLSELESISNRVAIMVQGIVARQGTLNELTAGRQYYTIEVEHADGGWTDIGAALPGSFDAAELAERAKLPRRAAGQQTPAPPTAMSERPFQPNLSLQLLPAASPMLNVRGKTMSGIELEFDGTTLKISQTDPILIQPIIDALRGRAFIIRRIGVFRPSLEELFFEAVTDPATGQRVAPGARPGQKSGGAA